MARDTNKIITINSIIGRAIKEYMLLGREGRMKRGHSPEQDFAADSAEFGGQPVNQQSFGVFGGGQEEVAPLFREHDRRPSNAVSHKPPFRKAKHLPKPDDSSGNYKPESEPEPFHQQNFVWENAHVQQPGWEEGQDEEMGSITKKTKKENTRMMPRQMSQSQRKREQRKRDYRKRDYRKRDK